MSQFRSYFRVLLGCLNRKLSRKGYGVRNRAIIWLIFRVSSILATSHFLNRLHLRPK